MQDWESIERDLAAKEAELLEKELPQTKEPSSWISFLTLSRYNMNIKWKCNDTYAQKDVIWLIWIFNTHHIRLVLCLRRMCAATATGAQGGDSESGFQMFWRYTPCVKVVDKASWDTFAIPSVKPTCTSETWYHKDLLFEIGEGIAYLTLNRSGEASRPVCAR